MLFKPRNVPFTHSFTWQKSVPLQEQFARFSVARLGVCWFCPNFVHRDSFSSVAHKCFLFSTCHHFWLPGSSACSSIVTKLNSHFGQQLRSILTFLLAQDLLHTRALAHAYLMTDEHVCTYLFMQRSLDFFGYRCSCLKGPEVTLH